MPRRKAMNLVYDEDIIYTDQNWQEIIPIEASFRQDGLGVSKGHKPRDFALYPQGYSEVASAFPSELEIPESEWDSRIKEQEDSESSLEHLRNFGTPSGSFIPPLDQDGYGYCWAFSTSGCCVLLRVRDGAPYVPLSAWMVGSIVKNYRNQGGWCQQSLDHIRDVGITTLKLWPQGQVNRSLDTPAMRADAKTRRITEWWDLSEDQDKARVQLASCLLLGIPCATDFNWWSHSVCSMRLLKRNPFTTRILNSWGMWGVNGTGVLEGSRAIPNGAVAPRVITASKFTMKRWMKQRKFLKKGRAVA